MPATSTYRPTGNSYIDGILAGTKWAVSTLTFSFPTDPTFYGAGYGADEPLKLFHSFHADAAGGSPHNPANIFLGGKCCVHRGY